MREKSDRKLGAQSRFDFRLGEPQAAGHRFVDAQNLAEEIKHQRKLNHYGEINYLRGDDMIRSELALPIEADGVRVGVLNLESNLVNGCGQKRTHDDYLVTARRFAEKAGRLCATAHERSRRGARLSAQRIEEDGVYEKLREVCLKLWKVARTGEGRAEVPDLQLLNTAT